MSTNGLAPSLRTLFSTTHIAKPILRQLAERRSYTMTDVYRLKLSLMKGGFQVTDLELAQFFNKLEREGVGKYQSNKYPSHDAFTWKVNSKEFALMALDTLMPSKNAAKVTDARQTADNHSSLAALQGSTIIYLPTSEGNPATLSIKGPITQATARLMASFLNRLSDDL